VRNVPEKKKNVFLLTESMEVVESGGVVQHGRSLVGGARTGDTLGRSTTTGREKEEEGSIMCMHE
jgi:hypothetical protein